MNYERVIPRDLFNEAKLLKCFGRLALLVLDGMVPEGMDIKIESSGDPFDIKLTEEGSLYIDNYPVTINGTVVWFKTTYNSKAPYPFYCEWDYVDYEVFDEEGNFTEEFKNLANILK